MGAVSGESALKPGTQTATTSAMKRIEGRTAVVTGAASGIGRAIAEALAAAGCHLAVCDRNEAGLEETREKIRAMGRRVSSHVVDVSNKDRMRSLVDDVLAFHGGVNILVNNAGVTTISSFESVALEDFEWVMNVNFWGVVYGCKFFLPALKSAEEAHIVNVSSVFGILGVPMQSSYCSSKFAVRGFSESLRAELSDSKVGVTSVHPAGVATNIVKDARYSHEASNKMKAGLVSDFANKMLPPDQAAKKILEAIERDRPRVLIARGAGLIDAVQRISPVLGSKLTVRVWKKMHEAREKAQ
jgi:NAD(P)-dependent dehydrogenase (short-subunit alcohol dehydrogenase family)